MSEEQPTPPTSETQVPSLLQVYRLNLDGPLLKEQRIAVRKMIDDPSVDSTYVPSLNGIENLLDSLADQAWDDHGIDAMLATPPDVILTYIQRKHMPLEVVDDVLASVVNVPVPPPIERQISTLLNLLGLAELRRRIDVAAAARATSSSAVE